MIHYRLREITQPLDSDESLLPLHVARSLGLNPADLHDFRLVRKAIDARKKSSILKVYTVEFKVSSDFILSQQQAENPYLSRVASVPDYQVPLCKHKKRVVIAGMGPAGLFAALSLCHSGAEVLLIERGKPVEERLRDVRDYWRGARLNLHSNVQFGEGGAGTFSDGKLTTRINHPLVQEVLRKFVEFGAPPEILYQAKPHIGSDRLRRVLIEMRRWLLHRGVEIRYHTCLSGLVSKASKLGAVVLDEQHEEPCDSLVLAIGHSARDTYQMLHSQQISMQSKAFAIGLRVEHPSELINRIQYGVSRHPQLGAAEYHLNWQDKNNGRGVYSFCMCPGGVIIGAASEMEGVVVNGMSDFKRAAPFSNSALVVTVEPGDFSGTDPLAGVAFQRTWEKRAFKAGGSTGRPPGQPLCSFLDGRSGELHTSCQPAAVEADLSSVLPAEVCQSLRRALPVFNQKMRGFVGPEAMLVGIESRTSAPLRILRNSSGESPSLAGLFPAGEGAGYAGGIMSAAIDGIRSAENVVKYLNNL
jgi:uncharacterized FAD-dependent dehydrogenase